MPLRHKLDSIIARLAYLHSDTGLQQERGHISVAGIVSAVTGTAPITSSGGAAPNITLNDAGVTLAKMANLATDTLIGRVSAGTGVPEAVTFTDAGQALMDDANAAAQRTTLGLGTLATQSGTFSGTSSGTNTGDQTITLTGEVTGSGTGSFAATVAGTHSGSAHHTVESGQSGTHTHATHDTAHAHSALTGIGATDHHSNANDHAASHTLTSHSTRAHSELTGVGASDHHAQSHTHASHTGIGATDHHTNANDPTAGEKTWLTNGLAGQVAFPATQSPSGGANVLDDYEEGTWTPGLTFGGGSTGITTSVAGGGYTKIGRLVYVGCLLQLSSKGSSVGSAVLTGLPFTINGTVVGYGASVPGLANVTFAAYPWMGANLGATTLNFQETSTGGAQTALTDADFTNTSAVTLSFFYAT